MRSRHRIPAIFTLYMIDVFCGALGVSILLMMLTMLEAKRKTAEAKTVVQKLQLTETNLSKNTIDLDKALKQLKQYAVDLQNLEEELASRRQERDRLDKELALTAARLKRNQDELNATQNQLATTASALADTRKRLISLEEERATAEVDMSALRLDLTRQERLMLALQSKLSTTDKQRVDAEALAVLLRDKLDAADKRAKDMDALLAEFRKQVDEGKIVLTDTKTRLDAASKKTKETEAELALLKKRAEEAELKLTDAQKSSQTIQVEVSALRKILEEHRLTTADLQKRLSAAETRFAGVDLGGRRVVLLVDISGSMGFIDANNPDPKKWPEVCRTVAQVLKSLPKGEKYQLITFGDETKYPMGKDGQWLDIDPQTTPEEVEKALFKVQPKGNTNMHAAFEAAFRFKPQGLDTIYVFSDGLPNLGPGLGTNPPRDEATQSALLSKYVLDAIRTQWNAGDKPVRIHAVGFFYESSNLGAFLWALTFQNGGSFVGMSKPGEK